jgi:type II secretory pathway pseudopilin PulG
MAATYRRPHGFSLIELTIAMGLMIVTCATVFALLHPATGAFAAQPEAADMQQRTRVAADALTKDLIMAGAGSYQGTLAGPLMSYFAPVQPVWQGGTSNAITVLYVPTTAVQTTLTADLTPAAATLQVAAAPNCPIGVELCGIVSGMTLLVYDDVGHADTFSVLSVSAASAQLQITSPNADAAVTTYRSGSKVVEAQVHTYSLKTSGSPPSSQLIRGNAPVVDHVVGLTFEYYGEPQPPALVDGVPTYGPRPPARDVQTTAYPPGENCTFAVDGLGMQVPRLLELNDTSTLTPLTAAQLTDGPWCPDDADVNRWDADLLRIRKIAITLRVETALAALRGPAGVLFTNGGSSRRASTWLPDQSIRWYVSPRNLNVGR